MNWRKTGDRDLRAGKKLTGFVVGKYSETMGTKLLRSLARKNLPRDHGSNIQGMGVSLRHPGQRRKIGIIISWGIGEEGTVKILERGQGRANRQNQAKTVNVGQS